MFSPTIKSAAMIQKRLWYYTKKRAFYKVHLCMCRRQQWLVSCTVRLSLLFASEKVAIFHVGLDLFFRTQYRSQKISGIKGFRDLTVFSPTIKSAAMIQKRLWYYTVRLSLLFASEKVAIFHVGLDLFFRTRYRSQKFSVYYQLSWWDQVERSVTMF